MNEPKTAEETSLAAPEQWVDLYGDYLFKHAMVRLRDPAKAEDVVQEVFLVALKSGDTFARKASAKSWLLGILKNKICDYYRMAGRETAFTDLGFYTAEEGQSFENHGPFEGAWTHELGPAAWPEPGASLDQEAFWIAFHECARKLPKKITAVFTLREVDGVASKDICSMLGISEKNLWVILHRARMALRRCLEKNWFKQEA